MDPSLKGTGLWLVPCGFESAGRLAAAALTGCQGRRCVWAHDFAPAFDTAGCDDNRCVVVGVPNEATPTTFKCRLGAAVSFVDQPALMAGLAAVGRVDLDERHPAGLSLIAQERAELSERPRVQRGPLGIAKPYPRTDPVSCSTAIPRPVRCASATMRLEI